MVSSSDSRHTLSTNGMAGASIDSAQPSGTRDMCRVFDLSGRPAPTRFRWLYARLERSCASLHQTFNAWGATEEERALSFPCDSYVGSPQATLYRGIEVLAPPEIVYRWLCQLRVAPYAYDWLDNSGRQSPRELTPGVEQLAPGQEILVMFEVLEFEPNEQITIQAARFVPFFTNVAMTYRIVPRGANRCRIVSKLTGHDTGRYLTGLRGDCFPIPEVLLMRKQMLTIKGLAERQFLEELIEGRRSVTN